MIPSQMLKGLLEGCILEIIRQQETYAYVISNELAKCIPVQTGFGCDFLSLHDVQSGRRSQRQSLQLSCGGLLSGSDCR